MDIHKDRILILDFGSQYTQLIARRVREAQVYCEIHPFDMSPEAIVAFKPSGIILSGGPESVLAYNAPSIVPEVFEAQCPILGICYGMQALAHQLGGTVARAQKHEYGSAKVQVTAPNALLDNVYDRIDDLQELDVWMSHGDHITQMPNGFSAIASSDNALGAIADESRQIYGLQFHPEVTHTTQGTRILDNFVHQICGCGHDWTPEHIIESQIEMTRAQVGEDNVVLGLSGGVDSSVVAALLNKAIGKQLTCVFVNNGLLRLNEAQEVIEATKILDIQLVHVDAGEEFLSALKGESCPEAKRKIIGNKFIEIFEREANKLNGVKYLAQGTIYPDVIESNGASTGKAKVIKSHHNVGGLPETMQLKLVEPLRELFKDEVRRIGATLGLPATLINRHPFPGPGLGIRVLGEVKPEFVKILQKADQIFLSHLRAQNLYNKVAQAFAVFLPVKSVGVTGDTRRYEYVIAIRAVETTDFMTARWARLPHELLEDVSSQIINDIEQISRVTYDISSKPPATIEWE
jgi:GMP synthase (glutamine-hydrolysing)